MYSFQFGNQTIPYTLSTSHRRKTLSISVDQHGVAVISPSHVDREKVEMILHNKAVWIIKQLSDFEEMNKTFTERSFLSGEKLPYLGRHYRLKVMKKDSDEAIFRFYQGRFVAELPKGISEEEHRDLLLPLYVDWIKQRGNQYAQDRIKRFTLKLQKEPNTIIIKDQGQRWGSCTPSGNILLNWRIFLAPTSMIDYVLAHELVHLKHMNHSKEYWETLRMLLPDYEQRKEWLRLNGGTLNV
ncbi:M48 family metallopeptidase [Bacillus dakarensis]|uniref:M48 family metallopeptidase n=1 Tax=Robertmurraya dakarensis TaxID=1926278 RepID=UPI0009822798|nr:SprT family zinc-dependent metalloprotease [Bacillus dakarensis]